MDVRDRACLMPGKNVSSSLGGPHRTPGPHSGGARNSALSIVKYQILFLLLKGKCTHEDLLITLTHMCFSDPFILGASPLPPPFQMWAMYLDCGFLKSAQCDRHSTKKWHYAPLGAPLASDWIFKKTNHFLWAIYPSPLASRAVPGEFHIMDPKWQLVWCHPFTGCFSFNS